MVSLEDWPNLGISQLVSCLLVNCTFDSVNANIKMDSGCVSAVDVYLGIIILVYCPGLRTHGHSRIIKISNFYSFQSCNQK